MDRSSITHDALLISVQTELERHLNSTYSRVLHTDPLGSLPEHSVGRQLYSFSPHCLGASSSGSPLSVLG